jgi:transcriptional regulator with XRE-family HTH domain
MGKQPFGELLREIREDHGISMRALATSADMDPAYLSRMENGKSGDPKAETVERLAQALCEEQKLGTSDCERLKRRLLVSAGHLQNREDLIDDLAERFAARLRDEGFPEAKIEEALARVPLPTMRAVLLGEEKLEIGSATDYSWSEVQVREEAGEDVLAFSLEAEKTRSEPSQPALELSMRTSLNKPPSMSADVEESASGYLDRHAEDFTTHRRRQRAKSDRGPRRVIRAGREAEIRVHRTMSKEQEQQLRLIAKLIDTILEEK